MEKNYTMLDGTQIYLNEDQICLAIDDPNNKDYMIITMSCGERLTAKPGVEVPVEENTEVK